MVDAAHSKCVVARRVGSSPTTGTTTEGGPIGPALSRLDPVVANSCASTRSAGAAAAPRTSASAARSDAPQDHHRYSPGKTTLVMPLRHRRQTQLRTWPESSLRHRSLPQSPEPGNGDRMLERTPGCSSVRASLQAERSTARAAPRQWGGRPRARSPAPPDHTRRPQGEQPRGLLRAVDGPSGRARRATASAGCGPRRRCARACRWWFRPCREGSPRSRRPSRRARPGSRRAGCRRPAP